MTNLLASGIDRWARTRQQMLLSTLSSGMITNVYVWDVLRLSEPGEVSGLKDG